MKLLGSTKYLIIKTKNEEIVQSLFLVKCNLVDNQYQQKSEVLYTFTPNKSYAYLLNVEPRNIVLWKTYSMEFYEIVIIFTDQNGRPLEIEDKGNLILLFNN